MRTFKNAFITGFGFMAGALTLAGIALWAQSLNTFTSGSVVSAGDLNANFTALNGRLDGLDTRVTAAEASITRIAPVGTILAWHKDLGGVPALPVVERGDRRGTGPCPGAGSSAMDRRSATPTRF